MSSTAEKKLTEEYEVWTSNGWKPFHGIRKTRKDSLRICFNDGTNIECSRSHKFYENGRFIHAYEVIPGDILSEKRVVDVQWAGEQDLYDLLEVENGHHYTASDVEYAMTKDSMYLGGFDNAAYYAYVERLPCRWLMSYDGKANGSTVAELPKHLYKSHFLSEKCLSTSFNANHGDAKEKRYVQESLYSSYELEKPLTIRDFE